MCIMGRVRPVDCLVVQLQNLAEIVEEVVEDLSIDIDIVYADEQFAHVVQDVPRNPFS